MEKSFNASGPARPGNGGISPAPDADKATGYLQWGSMHPDICQFAMADGRICRMPVKTNDKLVAGWCDRRDGAELEVPEGLFPIIGRR